MDDVGHISSEIDFLDEEGNEQIYFWKSLYRFDKTDRWNPGTYYPSDWELWLSEIKTF